MAIPTVQEIQERLEAESLNLSAANRKLDSLTTFSAFLLIALIQETQKANTTLEAILAKIDDD